MDKKTRPIYVLPPRDPSQIDRYTQTKSKGLEKDISCKRKRKSPGVGCRLVHPLWKAVWRYLKKLKIELVFDPAIPLLGIYLKKPKTLIQKNISTPMFIALLFTITEIWKQPKCPSTDKWIK